MRRLQPLAGRSAARIRQDGRSLEKVGLLGIVLGHLDAALGEALVHRGDDFVIPAQLGPQRIGHALAGEVVLGRPEASDEDQNVGALERRPRGVDEMRSMVANDGLEGDGHAEFVKPGRQEQGIGVLPVRSEHFRADRDDFGDHGFSLAPPKRRKQA